MIASGTVTSPTSTENNCPAEMTKKPESLAEFVTPSKQADDSDDDSMTFLNIVAGEGSEPVVLDARAEGSDMVFSKLVITDLRASGTLTMASVEVTMTTPTGRQKTVKTIPTKKNEEEMDYVVLEPELGTFYHIVVTLLTKDGSLQPEDVKVGCVFCRKPGGSYVTSTCYISGECVTSSN